MDKYLHVGGSYDGEWLLTDSSMPVVRRLSHESLVCSLSEADKVERSVIETEEYRRERFVGREKDFVLYVLDGMSVDEMVEELLGGYRRS